MISEIQITINIESKLNHIESIKVIYRVTVICNLVSITSVPMLADTMLPRGCTSFTICCAFLTFAVTTTPPFTTMDPKGAKSKQGIHRHQTAPRYRNAARVSRFTVQPLHFATRPNMAKRDVIHKTVSTSRRQRRTEPRPQGICTQNFVKIVSAFPETCSQTDRHTHTDRQRDTQTDRQADRNTLLPYRMK